METIIGLLFLLLPVIFKLIGKRLEQAGNVDQAKKMRDIYEAFGGDTENEQEEILPVEKIDVPSSEEGEPVDFSNFEVKINPLPVKKPEVIPAVKIAETPKVQPILMEETEEHKEKIDPKKLVIYSEIMKTKF